jgi:hypothetical protein
LALLAELTVPPSLPVSHVSTDLSEEAVRRLTPVARKIAPVHDQIHPMYTWLDTLAQLEADNRLTSVALPDVVRNRLRAIPLAYLRVRDELDPLEDAYVRRYGDRGGWTQLRCIVDWAFLINSWLLLEKERADQRKVVRAIRAVAPTRELLEPNQIRALGKLASRLDA